MFSVTKQFVAFIRFISFDKNNFQILNLKKEEVFLQQTKNVEQFKIVRRRLLLSIGFFLACFVLTTLFFDVLLNLFNHFWIVFNFLSCIPIFFYLFKYKCPNCMQMVDGKNHDFSSGVEISNGIRLFPSRCYCCEFYLSQNALIYDLNLQKEGID